MAFQETGERPAGPVERFRLAEGRGAAEMVVECVAQILAAQRQTRGGRRDGEVGPGVVFGADDAIDLFVIRDGHDRPAVSQPFWIAGVEVDGMDITRVEARGGDDALRNTRSGPRQLTGGAACIFVKLKADLVFVVGAQADCAGVYAWGVLPVIDQ